MLFRGCAFALILLFAGCEDSLTKSLNERFPPVNEEHQRQVAIDTTADALANLTMPNIAIGIALSDAQQFALVPRLKSHGVTAVEITGDKQLLKLRMHFSRDFSAADAGNNGTLAGLLEKTKPHVEGEVTIFAGLSGGIVHLGKDGPELEVKVLPAVASVRIGKIDLKQKDNAELLRDTLVDVLTKYRDNLSGELARAKFASIKFPSLAKEPLEIGRIINLKTASTSVKAVVTGAPVTFPIKADGIAWLVENGRLTSIAQISPIAGQAQALNEPIPHTFEAIEGRFEQVVSQQMSVSNWNAKTWLAVKKDILALTINSMLAQASICVTADVASENQHGSKKVRFPDGHDIACTATRNCTSTRSCDVVTQSDTRDCKACVLRIGNHCVQYGNDPICEASKVTQNKLYATAAAGRKGDCERLKSQERGQCELEKSGEKALCETKKEALQKLAQTGDFANLDVDASVHTTDLKICLRDFNMSPELSRVHFSLDVQGEADVRVDVKFVPLGVLGHITCQFPWKNAKTFKASLRQPQTEVNAALTLPGGNATEPKAEFTIAKMDIKAKLRPGPTEYLLRSPEILVKCPLIAAAAPIAVVLTPFIPELRGDVDFPLPEQKASLDLLFPYPNLMGHSLSVAVTSTNAALVGTAIVGGAAQ